MTWTWTIPIETKSSISLLPPMIAPSNLRVVVPTFGDWDEARATIDSILECTPRPIEIVLVNDNIDTEMPTWAKRYPILVVNYPGNRGPAFARNAGVRVNSERRIEWIYFTDTGCARKESFFGELISACMAMPRTTIAIAGPVIGVADIASANLINSYMTAEEILFPPRDAQGPQAIITANAAVSKIAFDAVGGFDPSYPFAAGEDLDLGLRLRRFGGIGWAERAVVMHRFKECDDDFRRRFMRYGAGNAHLAAKFGLPSMRIDSIVAAGSDLQRLADIQVEAMQIGYDRHVAERRRRRRPIAG